jgi:predicted transcriptional regulator
MKIRENTADIWSLKECQDAFIRSAEMTLLELAEKSNIDIQQLYKWSFEHKWIKLRKEYLSEITDKLQSNRVESKSDRLKTQLSDSSLEHFESYQSMYRLAKQFFQITELKVQTLRDCGDIVTADRVIQTLDPQKVDYWSKVLERGITGSRKISGADYEDINLAIASIERIGLKVGKRDNSR